jgi:hypothetical protein
MDDETTAQLLDYARQAVAREVGIPAQHAHRITGSNVGELRADAKALARELGVVDLTERARDDGGRYTAGEPDGREMNRLIRQAAGRE